MGFALQNSNVSRIFQTLGANIDDIPILWVAAPIWLNYPTYNWLFFRQDLDKIRTKKTLLLAGAILASAALFIMPNSPVLWFHGMLWIMDAPSMFRWNHFVLLLAIIFRKNKCMDLPCKVFLWDWRLLHQNYR
jgi:hypothetical protein